MSFLRYVVRKKEKELLDELYKIVKRNSQVHETVRVEFRSMLLQLKVKIEPFQLSRLLTRPSESKFEFLILLYHYTLDTLRFELKYMRSKFQDPIQFGLVQEKLSQLVAFTKMRHVEGDDEKAEKEDSPVEEDANGEGDANAEGDKDAVAQRDTVHIDHPPQFDDYIEEVPAYFYGEYFGYRWSTSGEVLRFYVNISPYPGDLRRTHFRNEYVRGNDTWKIDGSGIYTKRVLYLFGYAESADESTHFGLRFSALRRLTANDDILCGLLLTMNFDEPIAARILFIPVAKHTKSDEEATLSHQAYIDHMINPVKSSAIKPSNSADSDDAPRVDVDTMKEEILPPISQALKEVRRFDGSRLDDKVFFQLIRNSTPNVLRMRPDWSSNSKFKLGQKLADNELQLRELERKKDFINVAQEHFWAEAFGEYYERNKDREDQHEDDDETPT